MAACHLYIIGKEGADRPVKIGISFSPEKRLAQLQTGNADRLVLLQTIRCNGKSVAASWEWNAHNLFAAQRLAGGWFDLTAKDIMQRAPEWQQGRAASKPKPSAGFRWVGPTDSACAPFHPQIPADLHGVPISQMNYADRVRFWEACQLPPPPVGFDDWYLVGTPQHGVLCAIPVEGFVCQEPKEPAQ